ncbi:MAG: biotin--[acetyl-CoA-carboxylase] ligase family protein [Lachnospiraceae bacterium]|nr:biotin--[acetyl-CoA-carboxylase] ligase family protein [Lachnospiraceae bacterium]
MNTDKLQLLLTDIFCGLVENFESVASTNDVAKEYALQGKECLITAECQTAGKGRYDRTFESRTGGLYMTACLKVSQQILDGITEKAEEDSPAVFQLGERLLQYPVQAGEAVRTALEKLYDEPFRIKLPNDILLKNKKVCGILMEAVPHDDDIFLIFGIGINLENELSKELVNAANLKQLTGKTIEKEILCAAIIQELKKIL